LLIIIPGEPKAKQRPRVLKNGAAYTPKQTVMYENWVKECYYTAKNKRFLEGQIEGNMRIYLSIPKSVSKKKKEGMLKGLIRPTKRPDLDNICKSILDSLNGIAYKDDSQVVGLKIDKYYAEEPRVELELFDKQEKKHNF